MNAPELQALRRLLFFSVAEAARYIAADAARPGGVEDRTWNRWEAGKVPIPANIVRAVAQLVALRESTMRQLEGTILHSQETPLPLVFPWYEDVEDWPHQRSLMRPIQSAQAAVAGRYPQRMRLVAFDAVAYGRWARARSGPSFDALADMHREAWAREQLLATEAGPP